MKKRAVSSLAKDEVHVWRAPLEPLLGDFPRLYALLSVDEQDRCRRLVRERDRVQFGLCRGTLRLLLSRYCGVPAPAITFTYSRHGQPGLATSADLQFSVSHTDGMAVYALARERRVGIDVECVRAVQECDELVSRNFASEEVAAYRALPAASRLQGFFNGWTRKEAYVKALGEGLHHDLKAFSVSLRPEEPPRLLRARSGNPHDWTLCDLTEDIAHVVALAVEGTGLSLRCLQWPPAL